MRTLCWRGSARQSLSFHLPVGTVQQADRILRWVDAHVDRDRDEIKAARGGRSCGTREHEGGKRRPPGHTWWMQTQSGRKEKKRKRNGKRRRNSAKATFLPHSPCGERLLSAGALDTGWESSSGTRNSAAMGLCRRFFLPERQVSKRPQARERKRERGESEALATHAPQHVCVNGKHESAGG